MLICRRWHNLTNLLDLNQLPGRVSAFLFSLSSFRFFLALGTSNPFPLWLLSLLSLLSLSLSSLLSLSDSVMGYAVQIWCMPTFSFYTIPSLSKAGHGEVLSPALLIKKVLILKLLHFILLFLHSSIYVLGLLYNCLLGFPAWCTNHCLHNRNHFYDHLYCAMLGLFPNSAFETLSVFNCDIVSIIFFGCWL